MIPAPSQGFLLRLSWVLPISRMPLRPRITTSGMTRRVETTRIVSCRARAAAGCFSDVIPRNANENVGPSPMIAARMWTLRRKANMGLLYWQPLKSVDPLLDVGMAEPEPPRRGHVEHLPRTEGLDECRPVARGGCKGVCGEFPAPPVGGPHLAQEHREQAAGEQECHDAGGDPGEPEQAPEEAEPGIREDSGPRPGGLRLREGRAGLRQRAMSAAHQAGGNPGR